ncbi:MAG TPA: glycosyltransferase [Longimicrobiales bacterium]|nr:glycosyltransferase [Longimicrobiales bacterium]
MTPPEAIIVVPCYNEAARLRPATFRSFLETTPDVEMLLVDDGSTDATAEVLHDLAASCPQIQVHALEHNSGKAEAVRQGMLRACARRPALAGYWDADLAAPLEAIPMLMSMLRRQPALDMVMGSRVQLLGSRIRRSAYRHYLGRVLATCAAAALRLPVYDTQCGAKLLRVNERTCSIFATRFESRWLFDVELLARLLATQDGGRVDPQSRINEMPLPEWTEVPGSKVKMRDGVAALMELYRIQRAYRESRQRWQTDVLGTVHDTAGTR